MAEKQWGSSRAWCSNLSHDRQRKLLRMSIQIPKWNAVSFWISHFELKIKKKSAFNFQFKTTFFSDFIGHFWIHKICTLFVNKPITELVICIEIIFDYLDRILFHKWFHSIYSDEPKHVHQCMSLEISCQSQLLRRSRRAFKKIKIDSIKNIRFVERLGKYIDTV